MLELQKFKTLLETEMTRRQFLMHVGLAFLSIIGISAFLHNLQTTSITTKNAPGQDMQAVAYGWSGYSGVPQKNSSHNMKVMQ